MRAEAGELRAHLFAVFPEVKNNSVLKEVSPLRIDPLQRYVVLEPFAVAFEDRTKDLRQRKDRRTKIEAEPLGLQSVELAAELRVLLQDGDLKALLASIMAADMPPSPAPMTTTRLTFGRAVMIRPPE